MSEITQRAGRGPGFQPGLCEPEGKAERCVLGQWPGVSHPKSQVRGKVGFTLQNFVWWLVSLGHEGGDFDSS